MYLLDSNACIQFLNGKSAPLGRRIMGTKPALIKLCSIVKAELLYGAARSTDPALARARLTTCFEPYESIPFDDAAAAEYGRIRANPGVAGRCPYANWAE
jgi:tRNA(fMet)-specific endonuclease VapC